MNSLKIIKYYKTENIVEDICVVYGICYILKDNFIEFVLRTKVNHYEIEYDDSNLLDNEWSLSKVTEEDCGSINKTYRSELKKGALDKLNNWFDKNIDSVLQDINNQQLINKNNDSSIAIGTHFYTLSKSFSTSKNTSSIKRNLAFIGFIYYSTLLQNNSHEINFLMIPKKNSELRSVIKPSVIKIMKKEGGEFIKQNFSNDKRSNIELNAMICLKTFKQLHETNQDYESVFIMQYKNSEQKPLSDMYYIIDVLPWNNNTYKIFENIIQYSKEYSVRDACSKLVIKPTYNNFANMMKIFSKAEQKVDIEAGKDVINMYSDKVKRIFLNDQVQKMGRGLNLLINEKRGYDILTKLYAVSNETHITNIINRLSDEYMRTFKRSLLNSDEISTIISLMNDKKDAKIMSDAIISYGRNFYIKKDISNKTE